MTRSVFSNAAPVLIASAVFWSMAPMGTASNGREEARHAARQRHEEQERVRRMEELRRAAQERESLADEQRRAQERQRAEDDKQRAADERYRHETDQQRRADEQRRLAELQQRPAEKKPEVVVRVVPAIGGATTLLSSYVRPRPRVARWNEVTFCPFAQNMTGCGNHWPGGTDCGSVTKCPNGTCHACRGENVFYDCEQRICCSEGLLACAGVCRPNPCQAGAPRCNPVTGTISCDVPEPLPPGRPDDAQPDPLPLSL
jgi:hypothetical protein